jgi:glyoxylase-like metal-dependent hydrolase (beta-lactamase superfamily II)
MPEPLTTSIRMYGCLHTIRKERGLSSVAELRIPEQGRTGRDLARELDLPLEKIEGVFIDHRVYGLDRLIPPGADVAFVPTGVPGPHRYMLGIYAAGRTAGGSDQEHEAAAPSCRKASLDLDRLTCIDLDQPSLEGFRRFISSWLYRGEKFTLLVDPGPLSTIPHLVKEMRRLGVERLDHILLTHIHIDHAGGTGALLREFPEAKVICHPEGIRHLVAPAKLWEGSRKVLGKLLTDVYGEILPVPADKIGFQDIVGETGVRAFLTPGHAQHHLCFLLEDLLFAGEVAGVRSEVPEGIYMRPATPPRFALEVALDSLDRMIALAPRTMVFAHHGLADDAADHLQIARRQLLLWVQGVAETASADESKREEALFRWLLERDEIYRNIHQLPQDIHARERIFLGNTLRGMSEYVESLPAEERLALSGG